MRNLGGTTLSSTESLQANGLPGYTAVARDVTLPWGNRGQARFAVVYLNGMAYVFRGSTRVGCGVHGRRSALPVEHQDLPSPEGQ